MSIWAKIKTWLTAHSDFMSNVQFLAAMAHIAWAALIVLAPQFVFGLDLKLGLWMSIILAVTAGAKEYVYDASFEKNQTFAINTQDFAGYLGGIAFSWILIGLAFYFRTHGAGLRSMG